MDCTLTDEEIGLLKELKGAGERGETLPQHPALPLGIRHSPSLPAQPVHVAPSSPPTPTRELSCPADYRVTRLRTGAETSPLPRNQSLFETWPWGRPPLGFPIPCCNRFTVEWKQPPAASPACPTSEWLVLQSDIKPSGARLQWQGTNPGRRRLGPVSFRPRTPSPRRPPRPPRTCSSATSLNCTT